MWNEWLQLPVTYANLPASAQIAITVWDLSPAEDTDSNLHAVPFGGTTIPLFDNDNTLPDTPLQGSRWPDQHYNAMGNTAGANK